MDHLGHQLLAGTALAIDQHGQVGRRGLLGDFQRLQQLGVVAESALENKAALQQGLAALPWRKVGRGRLGHRRLYKTLLVRQLHHFVAQRCRLLEQFLDLRALQPGCPAQRGAQDLDFLDQPGVGDGGAGKAALVE